MTSQILQAVEKLWMTEFTSMATGLRVWALENMPQRYNQWELADRLVITLFCTWLLILIFVFREASSKSSSVAPKEAWKRDLRTYWFVFGGEATNGRGIYVWMRDHWAQSHCRRNRLILEHSVPGSAWSELIFWRPLRVAGELLRAHGSIDFTG